MNLLDTNVPTSRCVATSALVGTVRNWPSGSPLPQTNDWMLTCRIPASASARSASMTSMRWPRAGELLSRRSAHLRDLRLEPAVDRREDELAHVSAERGDLAHDRAGDELVLLRRRHEHRFDVGQQVTVHAGHLELVLEVADGAQAAHDHARTLLAHEILQQAAEAGDLDVRIVAEHFARDRDAF